MIDLESQLVDLGETLDLEENEASIAAVLAALASAPAGSPVAHTRRAARWQRSSPAWLRAAAVVFVVALALLVIPVSRDAIADWLGLDGVDIDRPPGLSVPADAPPVDAESVTGDATVVVVGGITVRVDEIALDELGGRLDEPEISKALAAGTGIERVDVGGNPGVWIDGDPHAVTFHPTAGSVPRRLAGNTLLWQDGDVIRRVEGFPSLDQALAFAATLD